jgi:hypothetical protein
MDEITAKGEWANRQEVRQKMMMMMMMIIIIIIYETKPFRYSLRHMLILSDIIYHIFVFVTVNKHTILIAFVMMCVCVCVSVPNVTCLAPGYMDDIKSKSKQTFPRYLLDVLHPQNFVI